ncbi:hypothetical protein RFI_26734, partial [Reticulomyxa filosa]
ITKSGKFMLRLNQQYRPNMKVIVDQIAGTNLTCHIVYSEYKMKDIGPDEDINDIRLELESDGHEIERYFVPRNHNQQKRQATEAASKVAHWFYPRKNNELVMSKEKSKKKLRS